MPKRLVNRRRIRLSITLLALALFLSGCLYPQSDSSTTDIVSKESMRNIQGAIQQYIDEKGILPIHNSDSSVDRYEKFRVNFDLLRSEGYIDVLPSSSFEGGGNFYFLVMNEETEPVVKAQSIYTAQKIIDIQRNVDDYFTSKGHYPFGDERYEQFYSIDYTAMNSKAPELHSMYSGGIQELLISESGTVYINYASDIYQMMQKSEVQIVEDMDLREFLIMYSDYVPVKSTPYRLQDGEPVPYEL